MLPTSRAVATARRQSRSGATAGTGPSRWRTPPTAIGTPSNVGLSTNRSDAAATASALGLRSLSPSRERPLRYTGAIAFDGERSFGSDDRRDRKATNAVARTRPARTSAKATKRFQPSVAAGVVADDRFRPDAGVRDRAGGRPLSPWVRHRAGDCLGDGAIVRVRPVRRWRGRSLLSASRARARWRLLRTRFRRVSLRSRLGERCLSVGGLSDERRSRARANRSSFAADWAI